MAIRPDLRRDVDEFLSGKHKRLPVGPEFVTGTRRSQMRAVLPIERNGEGSGFTLEFIMSPNVDPDWLRINLLYGRPCWRLCLKPEFHPNSFNRPKDLPASVDGPHHHSWADNRRFARANRLPQYLENARLLPDEITSKDQAFMWFLEQTGIDFPAWGLPVWPKRTTLL
jgi:hypothetical protein